VWGVGFRFWDLRFRVEGSGVGFRGSGSDSPLWFRVKGLRAKSSGLRVWGLRFRA